jgi:hypothetical protein
MAIAKEHRGVLATINAYGQVYLRNMPDQKAALEALTESGHLSFNPALQAYSITEKGERELRG